MKPIFAIAVIWFALVVLLVLVLCLDGMSWYVFVLFAAWILPSISTIAFTKNREKKWHKKLIPTFIFTFIFCVLTGMWVMALSCIPAFYAIGEWLSGKRLASQDQKRKEYNESVDKEIQDKLGEIQELDRVIKDKICTIHLLDMLEHCGAEVEQLASDPRISDIMRISSEIEYKRGELLQLEESKK